ncbi:MAG: hypothetical protein HC767_09305 [Akkermansiaceae bacterium]|nr:hypothetical protein [Akkermansiaceae bacterium]
MPRSSSSNIYQIFPGAEPSAPGFLSKPAREPNDNKRGFPADSDPNFQRLIHPA